MIFCSPGIVDVGIDLDMFQTAIWYGLEWNALVVAQANRRLWRLTQTQPVEIVYLAYNETKQAEGFDRVATRLAAMQALQGDIRAGLAQLRGERDFLADLQEAVDDSWQGKRLDSTYTLADLPPLKVFGTPVVPVHRRTALAAGPGRQDRPIRLRLVDPPSANPSLASHPGARRCAGLLAFPHPTKGDSHVQAYPYPQDHHRRRRPAVPPGLLRTGSQAADRRARSPSGNCRSPSSRATGLEHYGAGALSSSELLTLAVGFASLTEAEELLVKGNKLAGLATMPWSELVSMKGISRSRAARLKAAFELGRRLLVAAPMERPGDQVARRCRQPAHAGDGRLGAGAPDDADPGHQEPRR